ncbi:MAG: peptide-methionine (R)-S-oxide reductase [Parcubacteria bacterium C7867-004]|nr:MAG: peptide-methionine (R)-S-oxide reductase [Parcubacteria bacterium C7867-004]
MEPVTKTEEEWKNELSPEEYRVLREAGTEAPFTGKFVNNHETGMYTCRACGSALFSSEKKFDSGSGWPSFTDPAVAANVGTRDDSSLGMHRTEVYCKTCGGHLGHVFDDGPKDAGGKRYCINSVCLGFEQEDAQK